MEAPSSSEAPVAAEAEGDQGEASSKATSNAQAVPLEALPPPQAPESPATSDAPADPLEILRPVPKVPSPEPGLPPSPARDLDHDVAMLVGLGMRLPEIEALWSNVPGVDSIAIRAAGHRLMASTGASCPVPIGRQVSLGLDLLRHGSNVDSTLAALRAEWEDPPERFRDPIMLTLMEEPMVISSGHTFDKSTLIDERGKFRFERCPMTRETIVPRAYPLNSLKQELFEFKMRRLNSLLSAAELVAEREPTLKLLAFGKELLDAVGGFRYPSQAETFWKLRLSCTHDADTLLEALQELGAEIKDDARERDPATVLFDSEFQRLIMLVRAIANANSPDRGKGAAAAFVLRCADAFPPTSPTHCQHHWSDGWVHFVLRCFGPKDDPQLGQSIDGTRLQADTKAALRLALAKLRPVQMLVESWRMRLLFVQDTVDQMQQLQALHGALYSSASSLVERIVVSGAGIAMANGEYVRDGEYEGVPKFVHGQLWMLRYTMPSGAKRWYIADCRQLTVDDGDLYYVVCADDLPPCHLAWRRAKDGLEPMPLFRHVRGLCHSASSAGNETHAALVELLESSRAQLAKEGVDVTSLEKLPPPRAGLVASIEARKGWYIDQVTLRMRSGEVRAYGGEGGGAMEPFVLEEGERIVQVVQESSRQYLGARMTFTMEGASDGQRTFVIEGGKFAEEGWSERVSSHTIRAEEEVVALQFEAHCLRAVGVSVVGEGSSFGWRLTQRRRVAELTDEEGGEEGEEGGEEWPSVSDDGEEGEEGESDASEVSTPALSDGEEETDAPPTMAATVIEEDMQLQLALALSMTEQ